MISKKKIKRKWFQDIGIKVTGDNKKEINEAIEYIQTFVNNYEGNCEFMIYIQFV